MKAFFLKQVMTIAIFFGMRKLGFRLGLLLMASSAVASSCSGNQTRCYEAADTPVDTVKDTCYKTVVPIDTAAITDTIDVGKEK